MKTRTRLLLLLACALQAAPARAQTRSGTEAFDFLSIDADARAASMAGAYTALASGADAVMYNPAGLARTPRHEASFTHNQYVFDAYQEHLSLALRQGYGVSFNYLGLSNVQRTTLSEPGGTGQNFGVSDMALSLGYGRRLLAPLRVGVVGRYIRETIDNVEVHAFGTDIGAIYDTSSPGLRFGAAIQNMGADVIHESQSSKMPIRLRLGAAYTFPFFGTESTLAFDADKTRTDKIRAAVGFEAKIHEMLFIRGGYTTRNEADLGLTTGLGVVWQDLRLDYAIIPMGDLGLNHRITVAFRWGEGVQEQEPLIEAPPRPVAAQSPAAPPSDASGGDADFFLSMAQSRLDAKDFEKAKNHLRAAANILAPDDPRQVLFHERMGAIALAQGENKRAEASFLEAIRAAARLGLSGADVANAYYGMGVCLLAQDDRGYAERFFRKVLEVGGVTPQTRLRAENQLKALKN